LLKKGGKLVILGRFRVKRGKQRREKWIERIKYFGKIELESGFHKNKD